MMKLKTYLFLSFTYLLFGCGSQRNAFQSQENQMSHSNPSKPKLVIGIIVDQMRYDYLTRFYDKFSEGGFKKLIHKGFSFNNSHFNYIPTYTGPGHASVFTGTTPKYHGIISNNWYDKVTKKKIYCVEDKNHKILGVTDFKGNGASPSRMLSTTVTDQLKLHTQHKAKVVGIGIKDRAAVLPAGHTANAAYWFHGKKEGNWVSSSFYMKNLPEWVIQFNNQKLPKKYLTTWNTLFPIASYTESGPDKNTYEMGFRGKEHATFPYNLKELASQNRGYDILKYTPFGSTLTTDFALAAIENEKMGSDAITDFLTISYSSPDYAGHNFGVNSKEVQDTYLRLDLEIERLLLYLDEKVGKDHYSLFLTADHAAVHVPHYLKDQKIPANYFWERKLKKDLNQALIKKYNTDKLIEDISNKQIFLNRAEIDKNQLSINNIEAFIIDELLRTDLIYKVYSAQTMHEASFNDGVEKLIQNGYNQKRSGDILFVMEPNVIYTYPEKGSTHGSGSNYDTHVPLLFYGNGFKNGKSLDKVYVTDIAPTISSLLKIAFPSSSTGNPLWEALSDY